VPVVINELETAPAADGDRAASSGQATRGSGGNGNGGGGEQGSARAGHAVIAAIAREATRRARLWAD
jgi:hypothetical protein